jgi:hypothetical protein
LYLKDVQPDAGEKKEDGANAGGLGQERRGLGPEKRLNVAAESSPRESLSATGLEKDHDDQDKADDDMNADDK